MLAPARRGRPVHCEGSCWTPLVPALTPARRTPRMTHRRTTQPQATTSTATDEAARNPPRSGIGSLWTPLTSALKPE